MRTLAQAGFTLRGGRAVHQSGRYADTSTGCKTNDDNGVDGHDLKLQRAVVMMDALSRRNLKVPPTCVEEEEKKKKKMRRHVDEEVFMLDAKLHALLCFDHPFPARRLCLESEDVSSLATTRLRAN